MARAHSLIQNPKTPEVLSVDALSEEELPVIQEYRAVEQNRPRLEKIRAVHHKIAQMLASGMREMDVAAATGKHFNTITTLKKDPSFRELMEHYQEEEHAIWVDVRQRAAQLGMSAIEAIEERVEENPEDIPTKTLLSVMQGGLDYGGHRPAERRENLDVKATPDDIEKIKQRRQGGKDVSEYSRRQNVNIRQAPDGEPEPAEGSIIEEEDSTEPESSEGGNIIEGVPARDSTAAENSRSSLREESASGDSEDASSQENPLDRILG